MLEAIRLFNPNIRYYQASSSEIFGHDSDGLKNEESTQYPSNPYAISKAFAHQLTIAYREHYDMFACSGILFNHESPKRGVDYVSRHVTRGVAAIKLGIEDQLSIGNLQAQRDWGDARDYVRAMWLMLQQDKPGDYVLATGECHSVREFVELAFAETGRKIVWSGQGVDERGIDSNTGDVLVEVDFGWFVEAFRDNRVGHAERKA